MRHEHNIVVNGDFELMPNTGDAVLAYYRKLNDEKWLIVANLSDQLQHLSTNDQVAEQIIHNYAPHTDLSNLELQPYEAFAVVVR